MGGCGNGAESRRQTPKPSTWKVKHYLTVTDGDFRRASGGAKAVQLVQKWCRFRCSHRLPAIAKKCQKPLRTTALSKFFRRSSSLSGSTNYPQGDSHNPIETQEEPTIGDATARQTAHFPADLQRVIDSWERLDAGTRRAIRVLVDNNGND